MPLTGAITMNLLFVTYFTGLLLLIENITGINLLSSKSPSTEDKPNPIVEDFLADIFTSDIAGYIVGQIRQKEDYLLLKQLKEILETNYTVLKKREQTTELVHYPTLIHEIFESILEVKNTILQDKLRATAKSLFDHFTYHPYLRDREIIDLVDFHQGFIRAYNFIK